MALLCLHGHCDVAARIRAEVHVARTLHCGVGLLDECLQAKDAAEFPLLVREWAALRERKCVSESAACRKGLITMSITL